MGRLAENIEVDNILVHLTKLSPKLIEIRNEIDQALDLINRTLLVLYPKTNKQIMELISNEVCRFFDVTTDQIISYNRKEDIIRARHIYATMTYKKCKMSFAKVGASISRDHSTVLHSVKVINNAKDTNDSLYFQYRNIELTINNLIKHIQINK